MRKLEFTEFSNTASYTILEGILYSRTHYYSLVILQIADDLIDTFLNATQLFASDFQPLFKDLLIIPSPPQKKAEGKTSPRWAAFGS